MIHAETPQAEKTNNNDYNSIKCKQFKSQEFKKLNRGRPTLHTHTGMCTHLNACTCVCDSVSTHTAHQSIGVVEGGFV